MIGEFALVPFYTFIYSLIYVVSFFVIDGMLINLERFVNLQKRICVCHILFAFQELALTEVMVPMVLMFLLGLIHSQTVLAHFSLKPPRRDNRLHGYKSFTFVNIFILN